MQEGPDMANYAVMEKERHHSYQIAEAQRCVARLTEKIERLIEERDTAQAEAASLRGMLLAEMRGHGDAFVPPTGVEEPLLKRLYAAERVCSHLAKDGVNNTIIIVGLLQKWQESVG